jgi:hypothetical protein
MTDTSLSPLTPDEITALFTRADGQFLFARWGRPLVPVVFGVLTTETLEQALERSGVDRANKGGEAADTAVEMAQWCAHMRVSDHT